MEDKEKIKLGLDTLAGFFEQFGPNDIYKQVFLEVLFEELFRISLPLSRQAGQEEFKDYNDTDWIESTNESDSDGTQPA